MFTHQIHQQSSNCTDSRHLERDWALWATWFDVRVEFSKSWSEQSKRSPWFKYRKDSVYVVERVFPVKSSVRTARVLMCLLKDCFADVMNWLNVWMWNSLVIQWCFLMHFQTFRRLNFCFVVSMEICSAHLSFRTPRDSRGALTGHFG